MMLFTQPEISIFKVLRSSGLMKEISTNSVSIRKLNGDYYYLIIGNVSGARNQMIGSKVKNSCDYQSTNAQPK